jgi:hypothetical protein
LEARKWKERVHAHLGVDARLGHLLVHLVLELCLLHFARYLD